jgi:hypothetical protein
MSDRSRLSQETFELTEDEISPEHLVSQVQRAEEQLTVLRRQQELVERQKRELEELSRRQDQLQQGRADLIEKFTRALVVIEREQFETQRRSEMLQSVRESFSSHLQYFEALDLRGIEGNDLNRELTRALSALDDARTEFTRTLPRISMDNPEAAEEASDLAYSGSQTPVSFSEWLRNGFAFTLPLLVVGMLIFFALLLTPRH